MSLLSLKSGLRTAMQSTAVRVVAGVAVAVLVLPKLFDRRSSTINFTAKDIPDLSSHAGDGKKTVAVVTGARSGLGFQSALEMARKGAHVVMLVRSASSAEAAAAEILADKDVRASNGSVEVVETDLSDLASVNRAADALLAAHPSIHILMLNAGLVAAKKALTADSGVEKTFAVSHLAHMLLTARLQDRLVASAPARVVVVASDSYENVTELDYASLTSPDDTGYNAMYGYSVAKRANVLYCRALANRLAGTRVFVNTLHPGRVNTSIASNVKKDKTLSMVQRALVSLVSWYMAYTGYNAEVGAATQLYLATSPTIESEGIHGQLFFPVAVPKPMDEHVTDTAANELWDWSMNKLELYLGVQ